MRSEVARALPVQAQMQNIWAAIVATDAANVNDPVDIVMPDFDDELRWGPCRWQSRGDGILPVRGDDALVVFDNKRSPWIVSWWPNRAVSPVNPSSLSPGANGQYLETLAGVAGWHDPGPFTDAQLASPNSGTYRLIHQAHGAFLAQAIGTWLPAEDGTISQVGGIAGQQRVPLLDIQSGDYGIAGKTANMSMRIVAAVNATAPASTFAFRLFPVTAVAGGGGVVNYTLGANVASVSAIAPAASSIITRRTGDFALPSSGQYVLGVDISGINMAANSAVAVFMQLFVHYT